MPQEIQVGEIDIISVGTNRIDRFLSVLPKRNGSDLHLVVGSPPVLRLDGDMYESTMDALNALYDKVSPGGYVIVDDYCIAACREAIGDFRKARGITDEMRKIDWTAVFWRKGRALP